MRCPLLVRAVAAHTPGRQQRIWRRRAPSRCRPFTWSAARPRAKGWIARAQDLIAARSGLADCRTGYCWMQVAYRRVRRRSAAGRSSLPTGRLRARPPAAATSALEAARPDVSRLLPAQPGRHPRPAWPTRITPPRSPCPAMSIRSPAACSIATSCGPAAPSATGRAPVSGRSAISNSAPTAAWNSPARASCIAPKCSGVQRLVARRPRPHQRRAGAPRRRRALGARRRPSRPRRHPRRAIGDTDAAFAAYETVLRARLES